jgi:steroid delta-isomerase-like uncharacterized protein
VSEHSKRKDILANFIRDVWNDGDVAAVTRYLAPAYTIRHDPGDPWHGKTLDIEGFKQRLAASRMPFPDQHFDIQGLFEDENAVVMTWFWTATHAGDYPGFSATGKAISMSGATVYYFDGDRLCGHWQIADRLGVFQQLAADKQG